MGLALDLVDYCPSVLRCCWLGHKTHKIARKMTYNVLMIRTRLSLYLVAQSLCNDDDDDDSDGGDVDVLCLQESIRATNRFYHETRHCSSG